MDNYIYKDNDCILPQKYIPLNNLSIGTQAKERGKKKDIEVKFKKDDCKYTISLTNWTYKHIWIRPSSPFHEH